MDKNEALKLALGALECKDGWGSSIRSQKEKAITTIKHALAAPVQEPLTDGYVQLVPDKCDRIVWRTRYFHLPIANTPPAAQPAPVQPVSGVVLRDGYPTLIQDKHIKETNQRLCILPTTPPAAQRQWVGLSQDELDAMFSNTIKGKKLVNWVARAIEAKLKEKNT